MAVKKTASAARKPAGASAARTTAASKAAVKKPPAKKTSAKKTARKVAAKTAAKPAAAPRLLSGGNPQIPKGDGDAPVQAYIAAMPGWKRAVGKQLDTLITRAVPGVYKAVKWNSPLYGHQGDGWFLSFHCFDHYIKVAFFRGAALQPPPPESSKTAHTRYLRIRQDDTLDTAQLTDWIRQASALPGERM